MYNVLCKEEMCDSCRYAGVINFSECNGVGLKFPNGYSAQSKRCGKCGGTGLVKCPDCGGDGRTTLLDRIF